LTLLDLWAELRQRGVRPSAEGDQLVIEWAEGSLPPEIITHIRDHKANLLAFLGPRQPKPSGAAFDDEATPQASYFDGRPYGPVRAELARKALRQGLGHAGLGDLVRRVTGRDGLWACAADDLSHVAKALLALTKKSCPDRY